MHTRILNKVLPYAAALLLCSCETMDQSSTSTPRDTANDCFFAVSLSDWRPLDDENIILFAGRRNPYHAQLSRAAFGLSRGLEIGVYDRDGRVCPYGGDAIVIRGIMPDTIRISSMRRIDAEELEQLYIEYGIRDPANVTVTPVEIVDEDPAENTTPAD